MRIGIGYDVHNLVSGRDLILGGVKIPHEKGLAGHSDADVLVHAVMDSMIGAVAMGDIGKIFPDNNPEYKDISSLLLLERVSHMIREKGYRISNIDSVIVAQRPRLADYIYEMRKNISKATMTHENFISVKATTTERLGFEGLEEGISSQCVCMLKAVEK